MNPSRFMCIFAFILLFPIVTHADMNETPETTVSQAFDLMKQSGDVGSILDFIHWETAFKKAQQAKSLPATVRSPEEFREFVNHSLHPDEAYIVRYHQIPNNQYYNDISGELKKEYKEHREATIATLKKNLAQIRTRLKHINYHIEKSTIEGNIATVNITTSVNGTTTKQDIKLIKSGSQWLFLSNPTGTTHLIKPEKEQQ